MGEESDASDEMKALSGQKRHETEAESGRDESDDAPTGTLEGAIVEAYAQIDADDLPENVTVRDADLAALFAGLESTGRIENVSRAAARSLGRDPETVDGFGTRAGLVRLLVRIGLNDVADQDVRRAVEARREYQSQQAGSEF